MTNISVLDRFQRAQRTISWRNTHDTECPAFGLVEVTGYTTGQDGRVVVKGSRPDGGPVIGINGSTRVAHDAYGVLTFDFPAVVAVSGSVSNGEHLGPENGSWEAVPEAQQFVALGSSADGRVLALDSPTLSPQLFAYGFLGADCREIDRAVPIRDAQGIGWTIPEGIPHGPSPAQNVWGLLGRDRQRVKLLYVPSGFTYPEEPGGTPTMDPVYWIVDMIQPTAMTPSHRLRVDGLDFQRHAPQSVVWTYEDLNPAEIPWSTWATGEMCAGNSPARGPGKSKGQGKEPDCGCKG